MNNPMFGGNMPRMNPMQMNPMQMIQQLQANPIQFLKQAGFNVPSNINSPNDIIQHLMNSKQITQQQYEQARQMAARFNR